MNFIPLHNQSLAGSYITQAPVSDAAEQNSLKRRLFNSLAEDRFKSEENKSQ